jgi:hypothetical protein
MKSHRYAKTQGGGVSPAPVSCDPGSTSTTDTSPQPIPSSILTPLSPDSCQHVNGRGHRCRMLVFDHATSLCLHHQRLQRKLEQRRDAATARQLLDGIDEFVSAESVNRFLGNLVTQLARKRVARRDAIALAYISQLLLTSVGAATKEIAAKRHAAEIQASLDAFRLRQRSNPPTPAKPPAASQATAPPAQRPAPASPPSP